MNTAEGDTVFPLPEDVRRKIKYLYGYFRVGVHVSMGSGAAVYVYGAAQKFTCLIS